MLDCELEDGLCGGFVMVLAGFVHVLDLLSSLEKLLHDEDLQCGVSLAVVVCAGCLCGVMCYAA